MEVAENRLELRHRLAVQHHVHAKDAVGGGVMRPHGNLKQIASQLAIRGGLWKDLIVRRWFIRLYWRTGCTRGAHGLRIVLMVSTGFGNDFSPFLELRHALLARTRNHQV